MADLGSLKITSDMKPVIIEVRDAFPRPSGFSQRRYDMRHKMLTQHTLFVLVVMAKIVH